MEIKTNTTIVPTTVNRKVKSRVFVFTEAEAMLVRDVLAGGEFNKLAYDAANRSANISKLDIVKFHTAIGNLVNELNFTFRK